MINSLVKSVNASGKSAKYPTHGFRIGELARKSTEGEIRSRRSEIRDHRFISQKTCYLLVVRYIRKKWWMPRDKTVLEITDAREIYEEHVKQMPRAERLRLVG